MTTQTLTDHELQLLMRAGVSDARIAAMQQTARDLETGHSIRTEILEPDCACERCEG
jgi:3-methyladenine DNA glycosylase/8-oxoguanine DNA glycosylase